MSEGASHPATPAQPSATAGTGRGSRAASLGWLAGFGAAAGVLALAAVLAAVQGWALPAAGLLLATFCVLWVMVQRTHRHLVTPLEELQRWARDMHAGRFESRIAVDGASPFSSLLADVNRLAERFRALSGRMEDRVRVQTADIRRKTRSLEILYDVAASISSSRDLDDLLTRFLHTLKEVVNARGATVRLLDVGGEMRLVASTEGLDEEMMRRERMTPALSDDGALVPARSGTENQAANQVEMITVPLQYRGRTLGVYNLFIDRAQLAGWQDERDLLTSIGRHLGMAIEKAGVDEEANRLSIIEERNRIAHELHDSLAQTLASLRFQVRVLDETLHQGDESALWQELERIENSLDEAYAELRGLIDHFRAPIDRRGLVPAVEKLVERFRNESDIQIFLQQDWKSDNLPEDQEIQVLRIIQEALANVRKHSQAHTVRVLMRAGTGPDPVYQVLIEDDGVGIPEQRPAGGPGEHVGLAIMEERARRLGGELRIESEPGEGTRVQLEFRIRKTENGSTGALHTGIAS